MEKPAQSLKSPKPHSWLWIVGGLLIGLALGAAAWIWIGPGKELLSEGSQTALPPVVSKMNSPAPDFELNDLEGHPIRLSDLRGRAVALNFWATWCGPCKLEMPLLQQAADRHPDELVVLAIDFQESQKTVQEFVDELNLDLPVVIDTDGEVNRLFRIRGFPTTLFIDQAGNLRYQHIGILNQSNLEGYLQDLGIEQ